MKELKDFCNYILNNHLDNITTLYLQRAREINLRILSAFYGMSESDILLVIKNNFFELLRAIVEGRENEHAIDTIKQWKGGLFPLIKPDQPGLNDLIKIISIRKYTFLKILPKYTQNIDLHTEVILQINDFYDLYREKVYEAFLEIQNEALRKEQEFLHLILDITNEGITAIDNNWNIKIWNKAVERRTGIKKEDALEKNLFEVFTHLPGTVEYEAMLRARKGETVYLYEIPVKIREGYYDLCVAPYCDKNGNIIGTLSFSRDITELKKKNDEFQYTNNNLQEKIKQLEEIQEELTKALEKLQNAEEQLIGLNHGLENRVNERTAELAESQEELRQTLEQSLQLNRQLAEREIFLSGILEQTPFSTWVSDAEGTQIKVNKACLDLFGLKDPGLGIGKYNIFKDEFLADKPFLEDIKSVYTRGKVAKFSTEYNLGKVTHLGNSVDKVIYINTTIFPIKDEIGKITNAVIQHEDITEKIQSERALIENEKRLKLLTDALPVLISYIDNKLVYRFVNQLYCEWFNKTKTEIINQPVNEILGKEAYKVVLPFMQQALEGKEVKYEATINYATVGLKEVMILYVPHFVENNVEGFYVLVNDIGNLKKIQADLLNKNQELERTNLELDNFIYTASHDLKAPIVNLEGLINALHRTFMGKLDSREKNLVEMMEISISKLKNTIDSLTDIAKITKNLEEFKELVDLNELIEDVKESIADLIEEAQPVITKDLKVSQIRFSKINLRSIIYNLLSNAIKYRSPQRPILITISTHEEAGYIVLSVQDNGLGIRKDQQGKLFSLFKRMHSHVAGTGMGLYLIKRIIENNGGKVDVESSTESGSIFRVYLLNEWKK